VLLRACNAKTTEHAVALLQIAASMDAVSLLITHNPYNARGGGSALRAFPFVNVAKMVANIDIKDFKGAEGLCKDTGYEDFDGEGVGGQKIWIGGATWGLYWATSSGPNSESSLPSRATPPRL